MNKQFFELIQIRIGKGGALSYSINLRMDGTVHDEPEARTHGYFFNGMQIVHKNQLERM